MLVRRTRNGKSGSGQAGEKWKLCLGRIRPWILVAHDKQVDRLDNGSATVRGGRVASHCRKPIVKVLLAQLCEDGISSSRKLLRVDHPVWSDGLRDDL